MSNDAPELYLGDSIEIMQDLPDSSIDCCVTSPPYWKCRDYCDGQYGQESTYQEYLDTLVSVFTEVRRLLKDTGTLWLNIGDKWHNGNLCLLPHRLCISLQSTGWIVKMDNIWYKPNVRPDGVTVRPSVSHEYVFMLVKTKKYYYNHEAIKEPCISHENRPNGVVRNRIYNYNSKDNRRSGGYSGNSKSISTRRDNHRVNVGKEPDGKKNRKSVWSINTVPYTGSHSAPFPPELPELCIKAGCPPGGTVLDPFVGSGTTGIVAKKLGMEFIGIDIDPQEYAVAWERIDGTCAKESL